MADLACHLLIREGKQAEKATEEVAEARSKALKPSAPPPVVPDPVDERAPPPSPPSPGGIIDAPKEAGPIARRADRLCETLRQLGRAQLDTDTVWREEGEEEGEDHIPALLLPTHDGQTLELQKMSVVGRHLKTPAAAPEEDTGEPKPSKPADPDSTFKKKARKPSKIGLILAVLFAKEVKDPSKLQSISIREVISHRIRKIFKHTPRVDPHKLLLQRTRAIDLDTLDMVANLCMDLAGSLSPIGGGADLSSALQEALDICRTGLGDISRQLPTDSPLRSAVESTDLVLEHSLFVVKEANH
eukprot:gnl/Dysnectes_brevis/7148_a11708_296.p1 GENE.gnl/Dysnectes_brevis/7148_a11708_296~~gnl/Dysnectes_brevis/7148_a11708_296.p1  ORF type:complete len:351 (+),score=160.31 gnl/Dysnectes_brevis/7148_a11708_296:153-1055(+)